MTNATTLVMKVRIVMMKKTMMIVMMIVIMIVMTIVMTMKTRRRRMRRKVGLRMMLTWILRELHLTVMILMILKVITIIMKWMTMNCRKGRIPPTEPHTRRYSLSSNKQRKTTYVTFLLMFL